MKYAILATIGAILAVICAGLASDEAHPAEKRGAAIADRSWTIPGVGMISAQTRVVRLYDAETSITCYVVVRDGNEGAAISCVHVEKEKL